MPVSGDFAELDALAAKIRAIAGNGSDAFRRGLLTACMAGARDSLDESFITTTDPYGNTWKPLGPRSRANGKPLNDTGRLASSFTYGFLALGFYVETNVYYARTHQLGAGLNGSPIGPIVPVQAKRLAWTTRDGRRFTAKSVRVPRRQMVPQPNTGGMGRWGDAVNDAADDFIRAWMAR